MKNRQNPKINHPYFLSLISGKGGVGKSWSSVNLANTLTGKGYRVAVIDADVNLADCGTLLNAPTDASITGWIHGECSLEELPVHHRDLTLVTASAEPTMNNVRPEHLMDALDQVALFLADEHDFVLIDTPAGTGEMTLWALDQSDLGLMILVDEPTSISDVYRLCKYVYSIDPDYPFAGIVNRCRDGEQASGTADRFNSILTYFLNREIPLLGHIPEAEEVQNSVSHQELLSKSDPESPILGELAFIADHLIGYARNRRIQRTATSAT